MNPLVAQQLKQISSHVEELRDTLAKAYEQLDSVTETRDELQKRLWGYAREIALLKGNLEGVADMREENARLHQTIDELTERLRVVQHHVRGLGAHLRP